MIFSILVILLLALVVYFHYLQGFFSAALSAVLVVISAMIAIGYHEDLVYTLLGGKYAAQAHAISLVCLFAIAYIVLRQIFDRLVPGNVRFPVTVDKVGAAVSGIIAGVFSVGIVVIAAHALPFGPSIAGYTRYPIEFEKELAVHQNQRAVDAQYDLLDAERFLNNEPEKLLIPVDDIVVSFAERVTSPGAPLSSGRPLTSVHPDYLQELFGQRIGMQLAASRVAQIENSLEVIGVYAAQSLAQDDQERWIMMGRMPSGIRGPESSPPPPPLPATLKPEPGQALLVVRATLDVGAADKKSNLVSFGPGNVRLVANEKNYFPIGTLEGGRTLLRNAPDDYLFVTPGRGVDLVFLVDESDVLVPGEANTYQTRPGTFLEFKRMAKEYLPSTVTVGVPPPGEKVQVVRKEGARGPAVAGGAGSDPGAGAAPAMSLAFEGAPDTLGQLPAPIAVQDAKGERDWGTYEMTDERFSSLEVSPTRTVEILGSGGRPVERLYHTRQQGIVQWTTIPQGETKWEWADEIASYELVDANNKRYQPNGVAARVVNANGGQSLVAKYDAERSVRSVPMVSEVKPTEVTLYWVLPAKTAIRALEYKNERVQSINLDVQ